MCDSEHWFADNLKMHFKQNKSHVFVLFLKWFFVSRSSLKLAPNLLPTLLLVHFIGVDVLSLVVILTLNAATRSAHAHARFPLTGFRAPSVHILLAAFWAPRMVNNRKWDKFKQRWTWEAESTPKPWNSPLWLFTGLHWDFWRSACGNYWQALKRTDAPWPICLNTQSIRWVSILYPPQTSSVLTPQVSLHRNETVVSLRC